MDYKFIFEAFKDIIKFVPETLKLAASALFIAFIAGFFFAFILHKKIPVLEQLVKIYLSFLRATPVILQIFIIYNLTPSILNAYFLKIGKDVDVFSINPEYYAYFALSLSATAFITEALRSAMDSIDKGQIEAGYMTGLFVFSIYQKIIIPQALCTAMPVITNTVADTIKATSLAFAMSVTEVTGRAKVIGGQTLNYFDAYIAVFFVYILVVGVTEFILKHIEKRLSVYKTA